MSELLHTTREELLGEQSKLRQDLVVLDARVAVLERASATSSSRTWQLALFGASVLITLITAAIVLNVQLARVEERVDALRVQVAELAKRDAER